MVKPKVLSVLAFASAIMLFFPCLCSSVQAREINSDFLGTAPGRFNSIKAGDFDGDGNDEIAFGNFNGFVNVIECKNGGYFDEWQSPQMGTRTWGVAVGDANNDGRNETIAGDGDGFIYIYNATSRKLEWKSDFLGRDPDGIVVGDVNGDSKNEVVVGTGYKTDFPLGKVYVFKYNKTATDAGRKYEPLKSFGDNGVLSFGESKHRGLAIADVDGDGRNELIIGSGLSQGERPGSGFLRVCDGKTGRVKWTSEDLNGDAEDVAVFDLDGDNKLEIVTGTGYRYQEGYLHVFKYKNGTNGAGYEKLWTSNNVGPKAYGLSVADIDGDGVPEIVSGNQPGYIHIFDSRSFQLEWKSGLLGMDVLGIAVADINGDGNTEIIAAQGGYEGKGDFTSAYTSPHIYIINGKTHEIVTVLGEFDYIAFGLQVAIVLLLITFLMSLRVYANARRAYKECSKK